MVLRGAVASAFLLAAFQFAPICSVQAQDYIARGAKALDQNQPAEAESLFRQAVAADPNDYSAHFNLALALGIQNKDAEAVAEYRKTLELKPGIYEADLNLGILLLRDRMAPDALSPLKAALDLKPADARPNLYYADALLQTDDAAEAARRYKIVIEADPKSAAAQLGLARSLLKESKADEAAEHYRSAANLDPGDRNALLELAAAYEKSARVSDAIAIYKEFPENQTAAARLSELLLQKNEAASAIPGLEQAVRLSPSLANRLSLADAYRLNKQPDKAIEQLQMAVTSDPSDYDLRMDLGRALRDQRRLAPAAEQFIAAAKLRPDSVKAWNELASALIVNENYAEGLAALDRVRALGAELPGDLYFRALALDKLRQKKPAVEAYRQFLAADNGKMPDQEFVARQRIRIIESELKGR